MDCEMVAAPRQDGKEGFESVAARVTLIDPYGGDQGSPVTLLDEYCRPDWAKLTKLIYRTEFSGITKEHLQNSPSLSSVRKRVMHLISGKLVIGHAIHNDLAALGIARNRTVPVSGYIDTQTLCLLHPEVKKQFSTKQSIGLKHLSHFLLGKKIQEGQHCSLEDCLATAEIFKIIVHS